MAQIHELMPLVKSEIGHIGKNGKHPQGYKFRKIEDVLDAVAPIFGRHKITTTMNCCDIQSSTTTEDKFNTQGVKCGTRIMNRVVCRVIVSLFAPDGSSLACSGVGEAIDYNDGRASNKAMAAGWKYAVALGLAIPFEGIDDNETTPEPTPTKPTTVSTPATTTPDSEVDPRTDAIEVALTDPCLPHQQDTIKRLWILTNRTPAELKAFLTGKRNVAKLADLTVEQASAFIEALERKLRAENIPF